MFSPRQKCPLKSSGFYNSGKNKLKLQISVGTEFCIACHKKIVSVGKIAFVKLHLGRLAVLLISNYY